MIHFLVSNIILLLSLSGYFCQNKFVKFEKYSNRKVDYQFHTKLQIEKPFKVNDQIFCTLKCASNPICELVSFNSLTNICMMFEQATQYFDTVKSDNTTIYSKNRLSAVCQTDYYADMKSETCIPQKLINETCYSNDECSSSARLVCLQGQCSCDPSDS